MAKKIPILNYLDEFIYFHIAYRFAEDNKAEAIVDKLSKISLSEFKDVTAEHDLEFITLLEQILPELTSNPYLTLEIKNAEIYLSKKKIAISFPKNLMKGGRSVLSSKLRRFIPAPREKLKEKDVKLQINSENLTHIDSIIKVFLIPEIMENKFPALEDITVIFRIKYDHNPKPDLLNQIIEKNLFEGRKFKFEKFDFEFTENKSKFYFSIDPDSRNVLCVFIYDKLKFSILESNIEELLKYSYNKNKEIIELLKL